MSASKKSKNDKEREKIVQDRLQILLTRMLQDDDNKYCVDCDSKGPRWASWNLGVFMCIRCAGIHRNLGVHISRVKSVNLDSWTPHQVACMQLVGNSRGRAIYEAQVSEDFRRPQTDSQLEVFIRAKYEKKKYIAREWVPPRAPEFPAGWNELIEAEKLKKDPRTIFLPSTMTSASSPTSTATTPTSSAATVTTSRPTTTTHTTVPQPKEAPVTAPAPSAASLLSNDLLGLSLGGAPEAQAAAKPVAAASKASSSSFSSDLLGLSSNVQSDFDFLGGVSSVAPASAVNSQNNVFNNNTPHTSKSESNLFDLDTNGGFGNQNSKSETSSATTKMSKDSILALFNQPPAQHQPPPPQHQMTAQHQNFMTVGQKNQFNNFGMAAMNNPFLPMTSAAHSTPNIDQTKTSAFADLSGRNFFQ